MPDENIGDFSVGPFILGLSLAFAVVFGIYVYNVEALDLLFSADKAKTVTDSVSNNSTPLESFNVYNEIKFFLFDNLAINVLIIFFLIIFFFYILNNNLSIKNNVPLILFFKSIFDNFFLIFKNLVTSIRFERYFFIIISIFIFVVFENIGGFYLLELSLNSHAIITLFISFTLFFNFVISFIINFNEYSYKKFIQKNVNLYFGIFLFLIEFISFFIRPFSLGIRLFANILSGHILIHIFFNAFILLFKFIFWYSILIFFFCLFVLLLEIFVAGVQSYIFLILNLIYLEETSKTH